MINAKRSIITTKRMEKQQKPQSCGRSMSSSRLWIVELIQRRRCESKTCHVSGALVRHTASGVNLSLLRGKCFNIWWSGNDLHQERANSFMCSVSTFVSAYSRMTLFATSNGEFLIVQWMRYMQKQPGRHVTEPKSDSNALDRW